MNITLMDYLEWKPQTVTSLSHGYDAVQGIMFRWIDLEGVTCYTSMDTIVMAEGFIAGFEAGLGADR